MVSWMKRPKRLPSKKRSRPGETQVASSIGAMHQLIEVHFSLQRMRKSEETGMEALEPYVFLRAKNGRLLLRRKGKDNFEKKLDVVPTSLKHCKAEPERHILTVPHADR